MVLVWPNPNSTYLPKYINPFFWVGGLKWKMLTNFYRAVINFGFEFYRKVLSANNVTARWSFVVQIPGVFDCKQNACYNFISNNLLSAYRKMLLITLIQAFDSKYLLQFENTTFLLIVLLYFTTRGRTATGTANTLAVIVKVASKPLKQAKSFIIKF